MDYKTFGKNIARSSYGFFLLLYAKKEDTIKTLIYFMLDKMAFL